MEHSLVINMPNLNTMKLNSPYILVRDSYRQTIRVQGLTHHGSLQGSSEGTEAPGAYLVPFTSQPSMGTQVTLLQHSPGILSSTALVPGKQNVAGQATTISCTHVVKSVIEH